jgi:hypothetical protein
MSEAAAPPAELDAAGLRAYVLGSLHLRGAAHEDWQRRTLRALGWYRSLTMRARARGVLFSWVYDLGHLLIEGDRFAFRSLNDLGSWPEEERGARLEYENRLLNGFLRDGSTRQAIELIRQDTTRDPLIARTLELLLAPLVGAGGHADAPVVDPVLLRELTVPGRVDPALEAANYEALAGEGALMRAFRSSLERTFAARRPGPALGPEDLAEIGHWSAYRKSAQRLAGRRIMVHVGSFPKIDPRGVAVSEEQESETELPDSGYYPSGGFSELANRGALENLVPTELVYMGEDPFGDDPNPAVDLFSLRVLEAETLYFARDSGQLRRTRRTVHVAVRPSDGLRVKLRWHSDPLVVMVYALCVRLSEDLAAIFPRDALRVELHLLCRGGVEQERAEEDRELLRVLLRHEIARGVAAVNLHGDDLDLRSLGERDRRVYGVAIQSGDRPPAGLPQTQPPRLGEGVRPPRLLTWQIGGAEPAEGLEDRVAMPLEGDPGPALVLARDGLLERIAGVQGRGRRGLGAPSRRGRRPKTPPLPQGLVQGDRPGEARCEADGSVLRWVPPGRYRLGTGEADPRRNMLEPTRDHVVEEGFYLGLHPVTWAQYRGFCAASGRSAPSPLFEVGPDHPVTGVTQADAEAYCAWAGLRLPTEAEWEVAARGADGRPYPWGEAEPEGDGDRLTCGRDADGREGATTPVTAHPAGASPFGCLDMAGNVWERVAAVTPDQAGWVRGGSWNTAPFDCRAFDRSRLRDAHPTVGFRACRSSR